MATIHIDGVAHEVDPADNLLEAALKLGYDLPYFCWHEALGSVGACRQCAVKVYRGPDDTRGSVQMACMVPARDGTRLSIADPEVVEARRANIEFLMVNHPHDCPVCDEGGECHLQDMTVMSGHVWRAYRFRKRTYPNQDLGPFLHHEMNRCIQCYRCVRFYVDYAGGRDFGVFGVHDHVWFGRHEPGALESPFAGNLVEVCPTGVFTDRTQRRHYARKWDLTQAPSVCVHCGVGCNTYPGERYGRLRRIRNRHHAEVNSWFLCDRGRFGYAFVDGPERLRRPRRDGVEVGVEAVHGLLDGISGRIVGIGSPRASLEDDFALRELVGPDNFFAAWSAAEHERVEAVLRALRDGPARSASLADVERADAVLVLGEDVTGTAPRMALSLRRAARTAPVEEAVRELKLDRWNDKGIRTAIGERTGPFFVVATTPTALDELATERVLAAPDDVARLGWAVARALRDDAPAVELSPELAATAARIAEALGRAERPVVVSGTGSGSPAVIEAAAAVARALCLAGRRARLAFAVSACNDLGLALLGPRPLREALAATDVAAAVVLGDPYRHAPAAELDAWFDRVPTVVVLDSVRTRATERARVVLPLATFAEATGTLVNAEGRAQRFFAVHAPQDDPVWSGWRWLQALAARAPRRQGVDEVIAAMAAEIPALAGVKEAAPPASWRHHHQRSPRQPHRYSGRTAMHAHRTMWEPPPPPDPDSPFAFSMEGARNVPPELRAFVHEPLWNSDQIAYRQRARDGTGPSGVRLLEPPAAPVEGWPGRPPEPFRRPEAGFLLVEAHEVFGTEELSALAPAVAARAPEPYLLIGADDAAALGVAAGDPLRVVVGEVVVHVPARPVPGMPPGVAALPRGLRALAPAWGVPLPAPASITRGRP